MAAILTSAFAARVVKQNVGAKKQKVSANATLQTQISSQPYAGVLLHYITHCDQCGLQWCAPSRWSLNVANVEARGKSGDPLSLLPCWTINANTPIWRNKDSGAIYAVTRAMPAPSWEDWFAMAPPNVRVGGTACFYSRGFDGCACGNNAGFGSCSMPAMDCNAPVRSFTCGEYNGWYGCAWYQQGPPQIMTDAGLVSNKRPCSPWTGIYR